MLNGIVLAGGLSSRFGSCKTKLHLNNQSVLKTIFELLSRHCNQVLVSCKEEKQVLNYPCIFDKYLCNAPISGICSSLEYFNSPVLVLSCDLPFIDDQTIRILIEARNKAVLTQGNLQMTTFKIKNTNFIEALVAIYETKAILALENAIQNQSYSLTKAILEKNRHHILIDKIGPFFNINYNEDLQEAKRLNLKKQR